MKKPNIAGSKRAFKEWAEVKGYRVVKLRAEPWLVGDVVLQCRSGKYTVALSTKLNAIQHGFAYPVLNATEAQLLEFLETDTKSTLEYQEYVAAKMAGELNN